MIDIDDLRPILQPLVEGRDDAADVLESITGIDHEVSGPSTDDIDAAVAAARAEEKAAFNSRYAAAFFGGTTGAPAEDNTEDDDSTVDEAEGFDEDITMADVIASAAEIED